MRSEDDELGEFSDLFTEGPTMEEAVAEVTGRFVAEAIRRVILRHLFGSGLPDEPAPEVREVRGRA